MSYKPIGVFDSGYGGLTLLKEFVAKLPQYDFLYLGDNARTPYGNRSFETVYDFTWQSVQKMFALGCELVILACNTASAKALRSIQQNNLPHSHQNKRVLGVIRPTAEVVGFHSHSRRVGILGTTGTIHSNSYPIEIKKFFPELTVYQQACPMWVPLVENYEHDGVGADYFVQKNIQLLLNQDPQIDAIILGCTHYPLLMNKILQFISPNIKILSQGSIVAESLVDYLKRHAEIAQKCSRQGLLDFYTTDSTENFDRAAKLFFGKEVKSKHIVLS